MYTRRPPVATRRRVPTAADPARGTHPAPAEPGIPAVASTVAGGANCGGSGARTRGAFTIVELLAVVAVIGIILALAVPALSGITREARFGSALQTLNSVLSRAQVAALAERTHTAVRFVRGDWDGLDAGQTPAAGSRMRAITYQYRGMNDDPINPNRVTFEEVFTRREDAAAVQLPADVWAAPVEAWRAQPGTGLPTRVAQEVLTGEIGHFELGSQGGVEPPGQRMQAYFTDRFLPADDFLIVYDAGGAVLQGVQSLNPAYNQARYKWPVVELRAPDPTTGRDYLRYDPRDPRFYRFYFSGIVLYEREPFEALGRDLRSAQGAQDRQSVLRRGRPYYATRGGGLVRGAEQ